MHRIIIALAALLPALASAQIKIWDRAPGDYASAPQLQPADSRTVDLASLKPQTVERMDVQYAQVRKFRGVDLAALLAAAPPDPRRDTAILHFANGVRIPVPGDAPPKAFVAWEIETGGAFTATLPKSKDFTFGANKIVWSVVPGDTFDPWRYVDTLVGIEWVDRKAYAAQFDVQGYPAKLGHRLFMGVCQHCHGAGLQGAKRGIDFVLPKPISETRRNAVDLHYHLMYPGATTPGAKMPAMSEAPRADAAKILAWVAALNREGLKPYRP